MSASRHHSRRAELVHNALPALWAAGDADSAAMRNQQMRVDDPVISGNDLDQVALDFDGVFLAGEFQ